MTRTRKFLAGISGAFIITAGSMMFSQTTLANTSRDFDTSQTYMIQWNLRRIPGGNVACAGLCRLSTSNQGFALPCPVSTAPQASAAACLTALAAACDTTCVPPAP